MTSAVTAPISILLAEDDRALSQVLAQILRLDGYRVVCAADGAEALRTLARETVDAVVTDVLMPRKDGLEFIQEAHRAWPSLPIVAISGGGELVTGDYCLFAARTFGATVALPKPFDHDQLVAAIDRACTAAHSAERG
jgi:DNA-binding NtrC family response regulator